MGVTTAYSALYESAGVPRASGGRPRTFHPFNDYVSYTIPTTQTDDAGDVTYLIPVASGRRIVYLKFDCADLDSGGGALDMDIILRTTAADGTTHTDTTILYNAGTAFNAAHTAKWVWCDTAVPSTATNMAHIILKVNTAASTPAEGAIKLFVYVD